MTKRKIIIADIVIILIWTTLLFFIGKMNKTEAMLLDTNPIYLISLTGILALIPIYTYFFITKRIVITLLLTFLSIVVATILSIVLVSSLIYFLQNKYYDGSAMGWTFKFRWLDLILVNFFSLTIIELAGKAINKIAGRHESGV